MTHNHDIWMNGTLERTVYMMKEFKLILNIEQKITLWSYTGWK